jgi:acetyl-CoA carboxylase alpha subunit
MENIAEPTIQELLLVLKHRARENAVFSYDAYADLVDEVVNERLGYGEFDTNEDIESLKDELLQRWPEVERYIERNEIEEIG